MMKLKTLNFLVLILISVVIINCDKDDKYHKDNHKNDECIDYTIAFVTDVNAPTNGMVNETINIKVDFQVFNGCGGFNRFIETEKGNVKTIAVEAKYQGCFCAQNAPIRTVNYQFKALNKGKYELNFKSGATEFKTINLTIN